MNLNEFVDACVVALREEYPYLATRPDAKETLLKEGFHAKWTSGGVEGGSCYGGNLTPVSPEPEADLEDLDVVLSAIAPQVTFIHYKRIISEVDRRVSTYHGYYGDVTETTTKSLSVHAVYEKLQKYGYLE